MNPEPRFTLNEPKYSIQREEHEQLLWSDWESSWLPLHEKITKKKKKKKIVLPLFPPLLQVRVRGQAASVAETLMTGKFHQFSLHSSLIPLKNHVVYLQICTFLPFLSHLTLECVHCQGSICGLFLSFRLPLSSITDPEAEVQKMCSKTLDFKDDRFKSWRVDLSF